MGRILEGGSVSAAGSQNDVFSIVAAEDLAANSLLLAAEDGYAYKANPLLTLARLNNDTAGAVAIASNAALESSNSNYSLSAQAMRNIVTFQTGEVVVAYAGDGTTSTTGVQLSLRNVTTGVAVARITVSADTNVSGVGVEKLTANLFVVWWFVGSVINYAVYDKSGAVVGSEAVGPTVGNAGRGYCACRGLLNGDFVFLYRASDNSTRFSRYNSAGVLQGAEVVIEAGTQNSDKPNIIALAAGGFICQWWNSTSSAWRFARYDAAGALQGAVVPAPNSSNVSGTYGNFDQIGIEIDAVGTIAVMRRSNETHNPWYVDIYNAANARLRSINIQPNGNNPDAIGAITKNKNGFATILAGRFCRAFSPDGGQLGAEVDVTAISVAAYSNGASYSSTWLEAVPSGYAVLRQADGGSNRAMQLAVLSPDFTLLGSLITLRALGENTVGGPCLALLGSVALSGYRDGASASPVISAHLTSRTSIFGVAQSSTVKGGTAQVNTRGSFELADSYTFSGSFDVRANTAPGNRGAVAGKTAQLLGPSI